MAFSILGVKGGKSVGIGKGGKPSYKRKKKKRKKNGRSRV